MPIIGPSGTIPKIRSEILGFQVTDKYRYLGTIINNRCKISAHMVSLQDKMN